ncbi:MAG: DNA polymerase I [Rikenellaceae bacterium]
MKRLFLIDAYALIFRYYYAFMGRPMRNSAGMNTSVVFGFAKFLREIIGKESPDLLGVVFDPPGGSFRRDIFPAYKANRSETPEDIILSVPFVKELVEAMSIPVLEVSGYEADDVIGTLSVKGEQAGYKVFMVTPDKDYGQLVTDNCVIYKQKDSAVEIVDKAAINAKYGIDNPQLVRDILAIWGDASDNIPGVMGIGEKGACKLVQQWGTVENILANVGSIKGKQGEKIAAAAEELPLSKRLTTICLDVPVEFDPEQLTLCAPDVERLRALYLELNFTSFARELGAAATPSLESVKATPAKLSPDADSQRDLFSVEPAAAPVERVAQRDLFGATEVIESILPEPTLEDVIPQMETSSTTAHNYIIVESNQALRELVANLLELDEFCFDTETTGLDPHCDRIVGLSIAVRPFEAWYIPFSRENQRERAEIIRPLFESEKIAKIGQNIKFDLMFMRMLGVEVAGKLLDTMLLHYLLDAESRHNMNYLAERYLSYTPIAIESIIGKGVRQLTMDQVSLPIIAEYAAEDADVTLRLKEVLYAAVVAEGLEELYFSIEEPMIRVLADIELEGVKIDSEALAEYAKELSVKLVQLEEQIRIETGEASLNINSPRQLGEVLFAKMKIAAKPKLTKTKQYSTDEEYLQGFAKEHKVVEMILEYRGIKKLLSTYVEALPQLINRQSGCIHTSYNQAVTATGRLSSTNPNLQNIPIRDALGRPIRAAFIPSDDQHTLLSADYSQVELRLMAHLSGDKALIEAFRNGEDIHTTTAALLFSKSSDEVTSDERRKAKTANFGIIYGISPFGLSQRLDIPRAEAKAIIEGYFSSYPAVKQYMDNAVEQARESGFVSTLFGRRRYLRDITSRNAVARGLAERNAINAPIQGSAADVMKLAMIAIWRRFKLEGIKSRMVMQVHDEVVVDLLRSEEQQVLKIVTEEMENAANLKVKLIAEAGVADNWLAAH